MKKILLSSLLAVMAVTSANAKIASTDYADEVAQAKASAAQTAAAADATSKADAAKTAANSYTDGQIQALDVIENGGGNFVIGVTQTDGKVTVTKGDIAYSSLTGTPTVDTAMSDSSPNAVQNKVIKSYVDNAIDTVEGEIGDGYQKLDQKLKSTDGEATITDANRDLLYPSYAKAAAMVTAGVQSAQTYTDGQITGLTNEAEGTGSNDGKYVTSVTQTGGKIKASVVSFDAAMNADSTNAVQNKVIKTYVDNAIDTVEGDVSGKVNINQGEANKDKGLIVSASGELQLADVATDAELATVSGVANDAKTIAEGAVAVNTQQGTAISNNTDEINTINNGAVMKSGITAAKVAIYDAYDARITQNNDNIIPITSAPEATEGSEDGQYVLTKKVVGDVTSYSWELIDRALAN